MVLVGDGLMIRRWRLFRSTYSISPSLGPEESGGAYFSMFVALERLVMRIVGWIGPGDCSLLKSYGNEKSLGRLP